MMRLTSLLTLILGLIILAGCDTESTSTPGSSGAEAPIEVTLQLNWKPEPQFGGFYAAAVTGAYAQHGLKVEIVPGGASAPTVDMLGAGTVPFAIVSGDEIIRARAVGNHIVALVAAYQTNPQGIMTHAERGFDELADVFQAEGTLAIEKGLPYAQFLQQKYGFDKLQIVPVPYGDLSLFRNDPNYAMQCFVTSEPIAADQLGLDTKTFLIADSGYNPYTTVLATSEEYLKAHPETVKAMTAAVREGWQAYLADPNATNTRMQELNPGMDADTFAASAKAQLPLIQADAGVGSMTLERWETLCTQLKDLGVVENAPDPADCFVATESAAPLATAPVE